MIARTYTLGLSLLFLATASASAAEIRGVVVKSDPDRKEFSIEARGRGMRGAVLTFQVDRDTQIHKGKDSGTMADLTAGTRVRVVYETDQGRRAALVVTVQTPLLQALAPLVQPPDAPPPTLPAPGVAGNQLAGVLRRVALTDREIVVISQAPSGGAERETTLLVPQDAKITRDQKPIVFEDLKEGESAVVTPEKKDGKLVAQSIQIGAALAPPPAPASTPDNRIAKIRMVLKMIDLFLQSQQQR